MTPFIKTWGKEITIAILAIGWLLTVTQCQPKESTVTTVKDVEVIIPGTSGEFTQPDKKQELPSAGKDSVKVGPRYIVIPSKINKEAFEKYHKAQDSIAKLNVLLEETRQRDYFFEFDNDKINIKIKAVAFGRVESVTPTYKIKPTTATVQQTETVRTVVEPPKVKDVVSINGQLGLLAGGGYTQNLTTQKPAYSLDVGVRIQKIYILGTINTNVDAGVKLLYEF